MHVCFCMYKAPDPSLSHENKPFPQVPECGRCHQECHMWISLHPHAVPSNYWTVEQNLSWCKFCTSQYSIRNSDDMVLSPYPGTTVATIVWNTRRRDPSRAFYQRLPIVRILGTADNCDFYRLAAVLCPTLVLSLLLFLSSPAVSGRVAVAVVANALMLLIRLGLNLFISPSMAKSKDFGHIGVSTSRRSNMDPPLSPRSSEHQRYERR